MKINRQIFFCVLVSAFLGSNALQAQTSEATIFDEATIVYKKSVYGGVILHSSGWGASLSFGKAKTAFKSRLIQFDLLNMRHPKEVRTYNQYYDDSRSYVFGKINSFIVIRPTIGQRVTLFDKIRKSGVAVGYTWRVGPSFGFTKPVYLEIGVPAQPPYDAIVVERYDPEEHTVDEIFGRAGFFKGFSEIKINPGLHAGFGFNFEFDSERSGIKGIEVGATADYYPFSEAEIMAFAQNYNLLFNFYASFQFGRKSN